MSLRDALLAKGLVSKKDAQRVGRELKEERRKEQGSRRSQSELEAERRAAAEAEAERQQEERLQRRREAEARRMAEELPRRARDLIAGNRVRPGRGQWFFHPLPGGQRLGRLEVSSGVAWRLRCGELALAWLDRGEGSEAVVIPAAAAEKLLALKPELLLFRVTDTAGLSDPAEQFATRAWDPDLRARRVHLPSPVEPRRP